MIEHVDRYQDLLDDIMEENPVPLTASAFKTLGDLDELMYCRRFRSELKALLERHQLRQNVIEDDCWPEFLKFYISAVQLSPLEYEPPKQGKKQEKNVAPQSPPDVQQVRVSLLDYKPAGTGSDFRVMFAWDWPSGDPNFPMGVRRVLML